MKRKSVDHYIDGASDARRGLPPQSRHIDYMLGYNAAKINMAKKNPVKRKKVKRKTVKRKKAKRKTAKRKPRVTVVRKNPLPKYIIRAKIKHRSTSFYYDGYRLTASKAEAKRYSDVNDAKHHGEKVWTNFPAVASVGVIKA